MTTQTATRRAKALTPDPVPLAMQQGDEVYLILPVTVRQRLRDGSVHVIGSGLTRFAQPSELLRRDQVIGLKAGRR
jgi:hypothetical protein